MTCYITDVKKYRDESERPTIPAMPVCRQGCFGPELAQLQKYREWILAFVGVTLVLTVIGFAGATDDYFDRQYCIKNNIIRQEVHIPGKGGGFKSAKTIPCLFIYAAIAYYGFKGLNKLLPRPGMREGEEILSYDDPHFQLHLEYYQRYKTWTLPNNYKKNLNK